MRRLTAAAVVLAIALALWPRGAGADYLVADLSKRRIDITLGFAGAEVLLFGATDTGGDVVVVVRGPNQKVVVRHKDRLGGIWVNREWMQFNNVPNFYYVASSRPLEVIASQPTFAGIEVGLKNLRMTPGDSSQGADADSFRAALVRVKQHEGLYATGSGQVNFIGGRLFRTTVSFPATVEPGPYTVEVFLLRKGNVESAQRWPLFITKVGVSASVFERAHEDPALYGLVAVAIAVMAGWLGAAGLWKV